MAIDEQADDVFEIAKFLAQHGINHNSESALRSAVSRGYYAVFLAAQRRTGCNDPENIHSKVIYACSKSLGQMRTNRLKLMRELRVAADYFQEAEPLRDMEAPHDLTDWNANWKYIELWTPIFRKHLKTWKP